MNQVEVAALFCGMGACVFGAAALPRWCCALVSIAFTVLVHAFNHGWLP